MNFTPKSISNIKKLSVIKKRHSFWEGYNKYVFTDAFTFELKVKCHHKKHAREQINQCIKSFIIKASKELFPDCLWYISTANHHDMLEFHKQQENDEMAKSLAVNNPFISYIKVTDYSYMLILIDEVSEQLFSVLKNVQFPNGDKLNIDIDDLRLICYYPKKTPNFDVEAANNFNSKQMGIEIFGNFYSITFSPNMYYDIKCGLIDIFNELGIELEFKDYTEKEEKRFRKLYSKTARIIKRLIVIFILSTVFSIPWGFTSALIAIKFGVLYALAGFIIGVIASVVFLVFLLGYDIFKIDDIDITDLEQWGLD